MKIRRVEATIVEIPFRRPFVVWRGSVPSKRHVLVRVETDSGLTGWGEAAPFLFYSPETATDVKSMIDDVLADEIIDRDPRSIRAIMQSFEMFDGHDLAKAAIETALWDLLGQSAGLPIYKLLGGAVHPNVPLVTVLHVADPEEMAIEAREWIDRGVKRLKFKIGFGIERDEAMVAKVREAVGKEAILRVDAEEHYTLKEALRIGRRLEQYDLELISQPIARTDWRGMASLQQRLDTPLLADEGIHHASDVMTCIAAGAADMVNIKVLKCGGLLSSQTMSGICEAAHLPVVVGSMIEAGIGTLAGAHFALINAPVFSAELCGPWLLESTLLDRELRIEDGALWLDDEPGLGASIDLAKLEQYKVD
jgi:L-Ala-D/L-Glu epimerase